MSNRRALQAGFTVIEMMISTMIMMAVTGAVFTLMNRPTTALASA